ncbi:ribokinase [Gordonia sp. zg691]|uniref:Ribokinase n=1 Tax=Gordonia jinghuaiqii TaxID=2758710 RepID=A0A7D7RAZ4_9ACTN|nr:ribokinase [Gordonia jinghuaiqii]MBD0862918.1 ribokinase [Gordonia jinghuaiqii]MCR5978957.1 ribokinase [Gordonia jinghuaiqii]QMT01710.1 ribokinase [Gordonia jinghuaiqii]
MKPCVLVVGALNVDLVVAADRLPGPGETVVGDKVERHGGGKGANAAVAAARADADVRYCGAVGADATGSTALDELRADSIDVTDVEITEGTPTGSALIVVDPKGENQIAVGAGANAVADPDAVSSAVDRASGWAGSVLVSTEIRPQAVVAAVQTAVAKGMRCILNPAPVIPEIHGLLALSPIVTPNASELRDLYALVTGDDGASAPVPDMAAEIVTRTKAPVVVTLGGDGVLVVEADGTSTTIPAPPAEVRDTTGAGDTFNGVLAATLARGVPIVEASRRGVVAATLSVRGVGARSGMPTAADIDSTLGSLSPQHNP